MVVLKSNYFIFVDLLLVKYTSDACVCVSRATNVQHKYRIVCNLCPYHERVAWRRACGPCELSKRDQLCLNIRPMLVSGNF